MAKMTEAEAWELDERWTKNPPDVDINGTGFFAKRKAAKARDARMVTIDGFTAEYLLTMALKTHQTPAGVIRNLVHEKIAAANP
jgi:hypothetical protein